MFTAYKDVVMIRDDDVIMFTCCVCVCVYAHACVRAYVRACICACVCACVCVCVIHLKEYYCIYHVRQTHVTHQPVIAELLYNYVIVRLLIVK